MVGPHTNPDDALGAAAAYQRRARTLLQVARDQLGVERFAGEGETTTAATPVHDSAATPAARRTRRASAGGSASTR